jgi:hypothetical protein
VAWFARTAARRSTSSDRDGGKKAAEDLGVPYLGNIPLDPDMRKAGDEGRPFIVRRPGMSADNPTWEHVDRVMQAVLRSIGETQ